MICIGLFNYFQFNQNNLEIKCVIEQEKVKNNFYIIDQEEIIDRNMEENEIIIEQDEMTINRIINKTLNNIIDKIVIIADEDIINNEIYKIINNIII